MSTTASSALARLAIGLVIVGSFVWVSLPTLEAKAGTQPTTDSSPCALGDALSKTAETKAAKEAYVEVLKQNPASECAQEGLENAGPSAVTSSAEEITGSIPTVAVFIGLLLLLYYAILLCCRWDWLKRRLTKLGGLGRHVKHILRPRLTFTDFADGAVEGGPGAPLTARVKERLSRMRDEALSKDTPEYDLDFGTPREDFADQVSDSKTLQTALDSAGEVSDQTKLVAALIKIVSAALPIRRFSVSGSLDPPAKTGPSLTLMLSEEGRSESSTRLQGPASEEEPTAKSYMALTDPAAVWIQYEIVSSLGGKDWDPAKAESQAVLREGLDLYLQENLPAARKAFERAIVLDHTNWGAYVSLAVAEARAGGNYAKSVERILKGIESMRKTGSG